MKERRHPPIERLLAPLEDFVNSNVSGGVVLLVAALVALVWANSPLADSYDRLWLTILTIGVGEMALAMPLELWINDGLMAIFFLLVGLEIKRELLVGELASAKRAILPITAAVGGAVVPAVLFLLIVGVTTEASRGWGIPMATDIAFALGVLAILGSRIQRGLRLFVIALAIADDLIAVTVIALFYTADLSIPALAVSGVIVAMLLLANALGVQRPLTYAVLGFALWLALHESGVHGTIAGVLLAMTIPARQRISDDELRDRGVDLLETARRRSPERIVQRHAALWELETIVKHAQAPMARIEHSISRWVAFAIVPLFALANAGVALDVDLAALVREPVVIGIIVGLVVGKQLGIMAAAWLIVRSGLASLPPGVNWRHIYGVAWICGIGFTMSLFIAGLAYEPAGSLAVAKLGILGASLIAGLGGYLLLRWHAARSNDEYQGE